MKELETLKGKNFKVIAKGEETRNFTIGEIKADKNGLFAIYDSEGNFKMLAYEKPLFEAIEKGTATYQGDNAEERYHAPGVPAPEFVLTKHDVTYIIS